MNTNVDTSRVPEMDLRERIAQQAAKRRELQEAIDRAEEPFRARIGTIEDEMAEATRLLRAQLNLHDEENALDDNQALGFGDAGEPIRCYVSGLVLLDVDATVEDLDGHKALTAVLPWPVAAEIPAAVDDVTDEAA